MPLTSTLFHGAKFWLSLNVPQRPRFKEMIKDHGGIIVLRQKDADVQLVDHKMKSLPPETYSYQYVENSIRNGRLENLEDHRAGPSAPRPMGASHIPKKATRMEYSLQDDQLLFDWVHAFKEQDGPISGNKIYVDLTMKYPQHTWQSWRARYLKRLCGKPRPGGGTPVPFHELDRPVQPSTQPERQSARVSDAPANRDLEEQRPQTSSHADMKRKRDPVLGPATSPSKRRAVEEAGQAAHPVSRHENNRPPPLPSDIGRPSVDNARPPATVNTAARSAVLTDVPMHPAHAWMFELPYLSSPEPDEEDEEMGQGEIPDVDAWIDAHVGTGVDESNVIDALRCTSMDPELAEKVLRYLAAGKGIPDDIPGVWTAEDDKHLEGQGAREIERVLEKHGSGACNARWEYLSMARERGLV